MGPKYNDLGFCGVSAKRTALSLLLMQRTCIRRSHHSLEMRIRKRGILGRTWCSEISSKERYLTSSLHEYTGHLTQKTWRRIWRDWIFLPEKLQEYTDPGLRGVSSAEVWQLVCFYRLGFLLAAGFLLSPSESTENNDPLNGIEESKRGKQKGGKKRYAQWNVQVQLQKVQLQKTSKKQSHYRAGFDKVFP